MVLGRKFGTEGLSQSAVVILSNLVVVCVRSVDETLDGIAIVVEYES
jgi:hypothetical protein